MPAAERMMRAGAGPPQGSFRAIHDTVYAFATQVKHAMAKRVDCPPALDGEVVERIRLHRRRRGLGGLRARRPADRERTPPRAAARSRAAATSASGCRCRSATASASSTRASTGCTAPSPRPALAGRSGYWPRGKLLGGSGAINAMVFVRGQPEDFDDWEALGNPGWGWRDVLPYFRKLEDSPRGESALARRRRTGRRRGHQRRRASAVRRVPARGRRSRDSAQRRLQRRIAGRRRLLRDHGSRRAPRIDGERLSQAGDAPREPRVETHAHATRIGFEGARATSVTLRAARHDAHRAAPRARSSSCAGAINTPQLLQLSGVGPAAHLQAPRDPDGARQPGGGPPPAGSPVHRLPVSFARAHRSTSSFGRGTASCAPDCATSPRAAARSRCQRQPGRRLHALAAGSRPAQHAALFLAALLHARAEGQAAADEPRPVPGVPARARSRAGRRAAATSRSARRTRSRRRASSRTRSRPSTTSTSCSKAPGSCARWRPRRRSPR